MSQERLSMRKINEVLRLKKECCRNRAIARSCQISHSTVGEYLKRAEAAGLTWPLPEGLTEEQLQRLFIRGGGSYRGSTKAHAGLEASARGIEETERDLAPAVDGIPGSLPRWLRVQPIL